MIILMNINDDMAIGLEEAVKAYKNCPYTNLSLPGVCDNCYLNEGFIIEAPDNEGQHLHTTICRLLEVLDNTLTMIRENNRQNTA